MSLFEYVRRHSKAILFTIIVLCASGLALMLNMPVSLFPDVTFPRIVVLADNGEQPAERMMVEVTKPLEEAARIGSGGQARALHDEPGFVRKFPSGLTGGANVLQVLQLMQGRIANIRNTIPASAAIQAEQMRFRSFPILGYSLTSDSLIS